MNSKARLGRARDIDAERGRVRWRAYAAALGAGLLACTAGFPNVHPVPASSPTLLVATLRLGSLLRHEPRLLRDLVSRPWSRAYVGAAAAVPPLAMGFRELGVAPELAPLPADLVALVRIVPLVTVRRKGTCWATPC